MLLVYGLIVVVALSWGGYPLLVRSANVQGYTSSIILILSALVPTLLAGWLGGASTPALPALMKLVIAGIFVGVGMIAFAMILANKIVDLSTVIPIINTSMLVVLVVGSILLFQEPITLRKVAGIIVVMVGIVLLRPS